MTATRRVVDGPATEYAGRVAAAARGQDADLLRTLRSELARAAKHAAGTYERGVYEGLLGVIDAAREPTQRGGGLAPQSALLEPGSLPARMLLEIATGVRGANADLAERLDTDQWQVSRAGRRLRELGLATRVRTGRLNGWTLTRGGEHEVARLRAGGRRK